MADDPLPVDPGDNNPSWLHFLFKGTQILMLKHTMYKINPV